MPADPPPQWITDRCRAIGVRVRARREHLNLTQPELAERAGISWSSIQRIEAGATNTKLNKLLLVAHALDVPLSELDTE